LELFQGKHIRLAVTKWGKLAAYPDQVASTPPPPSKINYERNFSLLDLTVVANEMVAEPFNYAQQQPLPESEGRSPSSGSRTPQYSPHARPNKGGWRPPTTFNQSGGRGSAITNRPRYQKLPQHAMPAYHQPGRTPAYAEVSPIMYGHGQVMSPQQMSYQLHQYQMMQQQPRQLHHIYQSHGGEQMYGQTSTYSPMTSPRVGPAVSFDSFGGVSSEQSMPSVGSFSGAQPPPSFYSHASSTPPSPRMNPQARTFDPSQT
jgi:hypothetical protein